MDIQRALKLKPGQSVNCPPDRGSAAFRGRVSFGFVPGDIQHNHAGVAFIWVPVTGGLGGVWPSNRLGALS